MQGMGILDVLPFLRGAEPVATRHLSIYIRLRNHSALANRSPQKRLKELLLKYVAKDNI